MIFRSEPGVERTIAPPIKASASCDRCGEPAVLRLCERGSTMTVETYFCARHYIMAAQQTCGGA